jgi:hypothetical protein
MMGQFKLGKTLILPTRNVHLRESKRNDVKELHLDFASNDLKRPSFNLFEMEKEF